MRVATWGAVLGNLPSDAFPVLSQGFVPRLLQTVLRAEILAAISALSWMVGHTRHNLDRQPCSRSKARWEGFDLEARLVVTWKPIMTFGIELMPYANQLWSVDF